MTPQPSGTAIELVTMAQRAERELVVAEEHGYSRFTKAHLQRKLDDANDALFKHIAKLEQKAVLFDEIDHNEWAVEMVAAEAGAWRIRTGFRDGHPVLVYGDTLADVVAAARATTTEYVCVKCRTPLEDEAGCAHCGEARVA